jgi:hypothetical protein
MKFTPTSRIKKPEIPMSLERWHWPFKTPEERLLVVKYYDALQQWERNQRFLEAEEAPF